MMTLLKKIKDVLFSLVTGTYLTDDEKLNEILFDHVANTLMCIAIVALVLVIIFSPDVRKRSTTDGKIMMFECAMLLTINTIDLIINNVDHSFYVLPVISEVVLMLIVMMWMIFIDHCMYRSVEHIRRRYRHAILPVALCAVINIGLYTACYVFLETTIIEKYSVNAADALITVFNIILAMLFVDRIIHLCYILTATHVVRVRDKISREPRFLKLGAFIIPFLIGALLKVYYAPFLTIGIIITYMSSVKRKKYIDQKTGFYNSDYLKLVCAYQDRKNYIGGQGIIIEAAGHGKEMAGMLGSIMAADSVIFILDEDRFLILSESLRGSAAKMVMKTLIDTAESSDDPYTPEVSTISRSGDESVIKFAERLLAA